MSARAWSGPSRTTLLVAPSSVTRLNFLSFTCESMASIPDSPHAAPDLLVEVVDAADRPMARMGIQAVHAQNLYHRAVCVVIHDPLGRIFLQKRGKNKQLYAKKWDISLRTHVLAGESRREAAIRGLADELRIKVDRLKKVADIPAGIETGNEFLRLYSVFVPGPLPPLNSEKVEDGFFYTPDELARLMRDFRELLSPGLVRLWEDRLIAPG